MILQIIGFIACLASGIILNILGVMWSSIYKRHTEEVSIFGASLFLLGCIIDFTTLAYSPIHLTLAVAP